MAGLCSPIQHDLKEVERIFDEELTGDLPFIDQLCDTVRSYRGKMLRPSLLLLTAQAAGEVLPAHHTLAAVVEMVHMATLVHDDVLDEADSRRKQPTITNITGNEAAVLLGDYLISHAFHLCSSLDSQKASRLIGATTNTVCEGELLQNYHRGNMRLSEQEYLEIIRRKTAALTATACKLGAMFAHADPKVVEAMHRYGSSAGIAFQIIDDVLDIVGDTNQVGKTLGLDFALGKLTLPTIHALSQASESTAFQLHELLDSHQPQNRESLRLLLEETASLEYATSVAGDCVEEALRQLDCLAPSHAKTSLMAMAEFIVHRRF